jgi:hypothetical protein
LHPTQRAELLSVLAEDNDEVLRERAANALLSVPSEEILAALSADSPAPQLFRYGAHSLVENPETAKALLYHPRCPAELLVAAAKRLPAGVIQDVMENLEKLSNAPALAAALLHSNSLTAIQRKELEELARPASEPPGAFAEAALDAEPDPVKRATLLQRLARMRVVERVQLALKGNREERLTLIRDPCKVVQRAVLQSPRLSEREVEGFAAMAHLSEEVLRLISINRNFRRNYTVVKNLTTNPKTPLDVSLHFLPNLTPSDLKMLTINKNIPENLRTAAIRLNRQRNEARNKA